MKIKHIHVRAVIIYVVTIQTTHTTIFSRSFASTVPKQPAKMDIQDLWPDIEAFRVTFQGGISPTKFTLKIICILNSEYTSRLLFIVRWYIKEAVCYSCFEFAENFLEPVDHFLWIQLLLRLLWSVQLMRVGFSWLFNR